MVLRRGERHRLLHGVGGIVQLLLPCTAGVCIARGGVGRMVMGQSRLLLGVPSHMVGAGGHAVPLEMGLLLGDVASIAWWVVCVAAWAAVVLLLVIRQVFKCQPACPARADSAPSSAHSRC